MCAKHVLYIRTILRTLQAGIKNNNPIIKRLFRVPRKNLGTFMQVSTVDCKRLLRRTCQISTRPAFPRSDNCLHVDLLPEPQLSLTRPRLHQTEIAKTGLSIKSIHLNSDN